MAILLRQIVHWRALERWGSLWGSREMSLTPEFKMRFYFPMERLEQILDGKVSPNSGWMGRWKAYLLQFHKFNVKQIGEMLEVCASRQAVPADLWTKLQTVHWSQKLGRARGPELASVLHSLAVLNCSKQLKKGKIRSANFFDGVLKQAGQRTDLHRFTNRALSHCIYSFGLLQLQTHPLVPLYSEQLVQPLRQRNLNTEIISKVFWSWGQLKYGNKTHVSLLSETAVSKKHQATEKELRKVIWAWGILEYTCRDHWVAMLKQIRVRYDKLKGPSLATILIACARVGFRDEVNCGALLRHMVESKKLVLFSTGVLADIIWSLGKLQFRHGRSYQLAVVFVNEALKASRLEAASTKELCCLSLGLCHLHHHNLEHWDKLHAETAQLDRLKLFSKDELCSLIWAFGRTSICKVEWQDDLAAHLLRQGKDSLSDLSSESLCRVIVGWASCKYASKEDADVVIREAIKPNQLKQYDPQQLVHLCWGIGKLGIKSPDVFEPLAQCILDDSIINAFSAQDFLRILIGFAHAGLGKLQAVDTIVQHLTEEKLTDLKPHERTDITWALQELNHPHADFLTAPQSNRFSSSNAPFVPHRLNQRTEFNH